MNNIYDFMQQPNSSESDRRNQGSIHDKNNTVFMIATIKHNIYRGLLICHLLSSLL